MFIFTNLVWRSLRSTDKDFCPAKCFILGPPLIACLAKLPKSLIEKCSSKKKEKLLESSNLCLADQFENHFCQY